MPKAKNQSADASAPHTAGARPAPAGRHAKVMPERPAGTPQPSNTAKPRSPRGRTGFSLSRNRSQSSRSKKAAAPPRKRARSNTSSPQTTNDALAVTLDARRLACSVAPRIHIGEAMRRSGLDEYKVAQTYATVVDKLSGNRADKDAGGVQKLLVDVLKECSRHLDPPRTERDTAPSAPVQFVLIHEVARPDRSQQLKTQPAPQLPPAPPLDVATPLPPAPELDADPDAAPINADSDSR